MQEALTLNSVSKFHNTFQHPILSQPEIPSEERCRLRITLLAEELKELEDAVDQKDIVAVADALCDLQYVLSGAILEFGLGEKFKALFDEVQRSNMSKACKTREEAERTIAHYREAHNTECYYKETNGAFLVYRSSDNKTLKSVNYSPANFEAVIGEVFEKAQS